MRIWGPPNTNPGMYFAFLTVNTAKYSPRYFRICKYGPYLAFLIRVHIWGSSRRARGGASGSGSPRPQAPGLAQVGARTSTAMSAALWRMCRRKEVMYPAEGGAAPVRTGHVPSASEAWPAARGDVTGGGCGLWCVATTARWCALCVGATRRVRVAADVRAERPERRGSAACRDSRHFEIHGAACSSTPWARTKGAITGGRFLHGQEQTETTRSAPVRATGDSIEGFAA